MSEIPSRHLYQIVLVTADGIRHVDGPAREEPPLEMEIRRVCSNFHRSQVPRYKQLMDQICDREIYHYPYRTYKREGEVPNVAVIGTSSVVLWDVIFKEMLEGLK